MFDGLKTLFYFDALLVHHGGSIGEHGEVSWGSRVWDSSLLQGQAFI